MKSSSEQLPTNTELTLQNCINNADTSQGEKESELRVIVLPEVTIPDDLSKISFPEEFSGRIKFLFKKGRPSHENFSLKHLCGLQSKMSKISLFFENIRELRKEDYIAFVLCSSYIYNTSFTEKLDDAQQFPKLRDRYKKLFTHPETMDPLERGITIPCLKENSEKQVTLSQLLMKYLVRRQNAPLLPKRMKWFLENFQFTDNKEYFETIENILQNIPQRFQPYDFDNEDNTRKKQFAEYQKKEVEFYTQQAFRQVYFHLYLNHKDEFEKQTSLSKLLHTVIGFDRNETIEKYMLTVIQTLTTVKKKNFFKYDCLMENIFFMFEKNLPNKYSEMVQGKESCDTEIQAFIKKLSDKKLDQTIIEGFRSYLKSKSIQTLADNFNSPRSQTSNPNDTSYNTESTDIKTESESSMLLKIIKKKLIYQQGLQRYISEQESDATLIAYLIEEYLRNPKEYQNELVDIILTSCQKKVLSLQDWDIDHSEGLSKNIIKNHLKILRETFKKELDNLFKICKEYQNIQKHLDFETIQLPVDVREDVRNAPKTPILMNAIVSIILAECGTGKIPYEKWLRELEPNEKLTEELIKQDLQTWEANNIQKLNVRFTKKGFKAGTAFYKKHTYIKDGNVFRQSLLQCFPSRQLNEKQLDLLVDIIVEEHQQGIPASKWGLEGCSQDQVLLEKRTVKRKVLNKIQQPSEKDRKKMLDDSRPSNTNTASMEHLRTWIKQNIDLTTQEEEPFKQAKTTTALIEALHSINARKDGEFTNLLATFISQECVGNSNLYTQWFPGTAKPQDITRKLVLEKLNTRVKESQDKFKQLRTEFEGVFDENEYSDQANDGTNLLKGMGALFLLMLISQYLKGKSESISSKTPHTPPKPKLSSPANLDKGRSTPKSTKTQPTHNNKPPAREKKVVRT